MAAWLGNAQLNAPTTLLFDPTTGQLDPSSVTSLDISIPNGGTVALDMSQSSQLATSYTVLGAAVNGMVFSGGTTVNAFNNRIGDLRAPAASLADAPMAKETLVAGGRAL